MSWLNFLAEDGFAAKWRGWPFNAGYGSDWQTSLATYAYSALILAAICLFLRFLYGPKGIFRDHEMDREAEEMTRRELAKLDADLRAGRISQRVYDLRRKEALK